MASSALFCLNLQIDSSSENLNISPMHTTPKPATSSNIILLRGGSGGGKSPPCEEAGKLGRLLIRHQAGSEGLLVKRLGGGPPILLLSSGNGAEGGQQHILITSREEETGEEAATGEAVIVHALEADGGGVTGNPLGADGEPIKLPENLESLPRADHFPTQRHRWNTNEEIAAILISFDRHTEWQSKEVKIRPKSGSMLLYSRKKVRYRRDGYCWKKRKDGKTTREDHMKLKVQGTECIYGCYVHSAILPTFHRRCYWLLQNPDIVLVHYLNVPYPDDNKLAVITPSLALWADKKEWTKDELVCQLKPMFFSEDEPDLNNELEISTAETVEAIVSQLMEKQRVARQAALVKQLECGCPDSTCADGKSCSHPMRRISAASGGSKEPQVGQGASRPPSRADSNNQVSSTTGNNGQGGMMGTTPRVYSRDTRNHHTTSQQASTPTGNTPPLVLSLSQIQGGGGLLILNSSNSSSNNSTPNLVTPVSVSSFVNNSNQRVQHHKERLVLKQEAMETNSSCCHPNQDSKVKMENTVTGQSLFDNSGYGRHHSNEVVMSSPSKQRMEIHEEIIETEYKPQGFCGDTVVLLGSNNKGDGNAMVNGGFFNETLDLSQEDIQRTLSANMPLTLDNNQRHGSDTNSSLTRHSSKDQPQSASSISATDTLNPMDFIDSCDVVVSPTHVVDDDVFVNLDAFDMLGEFPDLETLDTAGSHVHLVDVHPADGRHEKAHVTQAQPEGETGQSSEGSAKITDYSPEWAYPEGGVKVLVTGPWHSSGPYSVLFDTFPVPTTLVQSGVLRCYCPAHEAGLATLQVACDGYVISNSVIFEYKLPPREEQMVAPEPKIERSTDNLLKFTLLQRLEAMDDRLQIKQEPSDSCDLVEDTTLFTQSNFEDRLVTFCQNMTSRIWRHGEELSVSWFASHKGMTLLHLAASLGYSKLVCAMLHWRAENSSLLLETEVDALSQDEDGFTPLMWACSRGHTETAVMLYKWNHMAVNIKNSSNQTPLECAKSSNHAELVKELEKLESRRNKANMMLHSNNQLLDITQSPGNVSPSNSIISLISVASTSKSHDGVFLRPGAVTRSESQRYRSLNLDLDLDSNIIGSNKMLSSLPSPLLSDSSSSSRCGNGQKLSKRSSVDSGIHMSSPSTDYSRKTKFGTLRDASKLSKFDRSMSLPINSPPLTRDNSFDSESIEAGRKMDFALCEIGGDGRSSSPLIDVEAVSDDENDITAGAGVGEQDARVLTLAEQIIAAMPDRIKNESEDMMLDSSPGPPESNDTMSDVFMEPLLDKSSSSFDSNEFNFEFSDHNYRYYDVGTPCSSLSPASSSCLQSPRSFTLDSPSPPPTTADFCEFFQASGTVFENDFSNLTLSDREQRELYSAAKIIQKAYRSYRGRLQAQEQDKERAAAVVIQNYYRRYKQYAFYKQATHAATVIQHGYRSYCEHKRMKCTQQQQQAAAAIQNYYRSYREQGSGIRKGSREGTPTQQQQQQQGIKRTYSQRRQHQAARKIQQFMRQSKNKLQRERAEKEKLGVQLVDVRPKLPSQGGCSNYIGQNNRSSSRDRSEGSKSSSSGDRKTNL